MGRCDSTSRKSERGRGGGGGVEIKLTETAFRAFLRQYDGMIREHAAKSELWIFRKIFELQNWYSWQSLLYVGILKSEPPEPEWGTSGGGGGGRAHSSHLPSQRFWHSGILTLEIKLALHWWEASARSQLLHPCSLLLSNCKIISTLIITLEC